MSTGQKIFLGSLVLMVSVLFLVGCKDGRTTCYGTEPDGDRETLQPCPPGWRSGESRNIGEDQYWSYEVGIKDKPVAPRKTVTETVKPTDTPKTASKPTPTKTG